jgi:hypothetical protein
MDPTPTTTTLAFSNKWDHFTARLGYRRMYHRVEPGLYSFGNPTTSSPVFASANYTLSFDALRTSLQGMDGFILVLDTKGINVWCAAGKGTFSTEEIVRRIEATGLKEVVSHRTLIVPQLGAPGVSAHEVRQRSGFKVEYGPVRAKDIPEYMKTGKASEEMRTVSFPIRDRAILIPVEIKNLLWLAILLPILLFLIGGWFPALMALTAILGGIALFPLLLPFLPTNDFTSKGIILGLILAAPFSFYSIYTAEGILIGLAYGAADALLIVPAVAYMALNFTGCSTYASRTGVRREIFTYIPMLVGLILAGAVLMSLSLVASWMGWA